MAIHSDSLDANGVNGTSNTTNQSSGIANCNGRDDFHLPAVNENGYQIHEVPYGTKRKIRVVILGAGASAIDFFKNAEEKLENVDIQCYEKNHDIGGTWLEKWSPSDELMQVTDRYPGCACDVPSVNYQFSWRPTTWSRYYSGSKEIWEYLKEIEQENNFVEKYVKLRHEIQGAEWDGEAGQWVLKIHDTERDINFEDRAEVFINAGGVLNSWKWPDIEGLSTFKGKLMHTARYDVDFDLTGKRVAVIGSGSSGVQCIAAIQKEVSKLYTWIRSPIWITAGFAQKFAGKDGANFSYTEEQKQWLRDNPDKYLEYRKIIESELNQRFKFIIKGSDAANDARVYSEDEMTRKLDRNPRLMDKIIPKDFNVGCRRPTPGNGFLESLTAGNTTCFTDPLGRITPTGFMDHEGTEYKVDVIICATGFDTSWVPRYPFVVDGHDLRDTWSQAKGNKVIPYLSYAIPDYPNHFTYCGPYGPLAHGSFFPLIAKWSELIIKIITKMQMENIKSLRPKMDVARQFYEHADLFLQRTAWTSPCNSWFKGGKKDGQLTIYPGSRLHFFQLLESPRYEDFDIRYLDKKNMFGFLGNGFATRESDGRDITDYLGFLERQEQDDRQPVFDEGLLDILGATPNS
ncbi:MAG: hypothetical protein M1827_005940 [Pycnora praestabilis]|nr:MAG: hypothetical protein M1827_005940 [Pycnora praestabilis]